MNTKLSTLCIMVLCAFFKLNAQTTYYITTTGTGNGSSWATASNDLQAMINTAVSGDKIFVAAGTYKPEYKADNLTGAKTPNNRNNAFVLKSGVKIYGGFAGIETSEQQRTNIHTSNATILSGDFNGDDIASGIGYNLNITNNSENAYHVIISQGNTATTAVDGLSITGGNANSNVSVTINGRAIYANGGGGVASSFSSTEFNNLKMYHNIANSLGGAISAEYSTLQLKNTAFEENSGFYGGAINYYRCYTASYISNCIFYGNHATGYGGGIYIESSPLLISNNTFVENNGGRNISNSGGGGIYTSSSYSGGPAVITNNIFWNNRKENYVTTHGDIFPRSNATPIVRFCVTQNFSVYSNGVGIINNQNPLFTNISTKDFSLQSNSPAINKGTNSDIPTNITTDFNNNPRIDASVVDIGAQEYQGATAPTPYTLTITSPANGTVTSNPNTTTYLHGTVVTLTATPNQGYLFDNWSGDTSGSTTSKTIYMDANKTVTANFTQACTPYVNIPDANFKAALLAHGSTITGSGISTIDTDGDGNICTTEAAAYTGEIHVRNKSITNLTGIEAFTSLTSLQCQDNQLTSLNVSQNTALTRLYCFRNLLTALDVSQNTNLEELACSFNQIKDIDVSANSNLKRLYVQNNDLSSCNVKNGTNNNITNFDARNNANLTCIEVDNVAYSTTNWTNIDSQTSFSTSCPTVWTGATDSDWANANNWTYDVPTSTDNATIGVSNSTYPLLDNLAVEVNDLTINSGANLTINTNAGLKVNGDFDNQGSLKMYANDQESASLKVDGTASGQVEFNRQVSDQWYLLSTPFVSESLANFVTNNNIETKGSGSSLTYAIGKYEAVNSGYTYYQPTNTSWTLLEGSIGYAIKRNSPGNLRFLGGLRTTSQGSAISTPNASNKWMLLSNGYTAHVPLNNNANGSNFLQHNMQYNTLNNTNTAVYLWDRATQSFQPYNQSSSAKYLQPGESFFVEAAINANYVYISGIYSAHNVGASALRNVSQTKINILVNSGKQIRKTQIKYLNNTTKGLDVGYDAGVFTGEAQNFNVFTQLADGSYNTTNFALQCVAKSELKTTVIPLGIKAEAGKEITFSTETTQFPTDATVYLEDTKTGSFINLAKQTYTFTTTEAMNGIGRFYIHTQAKALSIEDNIADAIAIVKNRNQLTINNLTETGTLSIYSVLGKEVVTKQVNTANNTIKLPKVATGMYVVTVKTANKTATKKIIIN